MSEGDRNTIIQDMAAKVTQTHMAIYGAEGQGGVLRELKDIQKSITGLEKDIRELDRFRWKVIGASGIIGALLGKLSSMVLKL